MKMLYAVGVLMLACAGGLLIVCSRQWSLGTSADESAAERSIVDESRLSGGPGRDAQQEVAPPLVVQAAAFALYLDPPKSPAPRLTAAPPVSVRPVYRPPVVAPKFRLLAISHYHGRPEKALAMVSEPGKGSYWVGQGDRLGHLVVERIGEEAIFYRDGNRSHEIRVDVKKTVQMAELKSTTAPSAAHVVRTGVR